MVLINWKKELLLAETTGGILQATLRSYLKLVPHKNVLLVLNVSYVYLYNTALSAQLCYIAGLAIY